MNLNPDLVRSQVDEIEQSIRSLEQIRALPLQEFLADQDVLDVACYRLLISIEAALSLCYHICAKRILKVPEGYAECFGLLADHGFIEPALSERLQRMARFQNMLIHMYWQVDHERVYEFLQSDLQDLQMFSQKAIHLISR